MWRSRRGYSKSFWSGGAIGSMVGPRRTAYRWVSTYASKTVFIPTVSITDSRAPIGPSTQAQKTNEKKTAKGDSSSTSAESFGEM